MNMTQEDWERVLAKPEAIDQAIRTKFKRRKVEVSDELVADLRDMMTVMAVDHYSRGMRAVQQGIIRTLDLKVLLGP